MRILFDGTAFNNSHQRGVQRVFVELLRRMPARHRATLRSRTAVPGDLPRNVDRLPVPRIASLPIWRSIHARWAWRRHRRILETYDLFIPTYFTHPGSVRLPVVLPVYDMIPERLPGLCGSWGDQEVKVKGQAIARADHFIAISQATADDLVAFYPRCAGRVSVVHLGAEHLPRSSAELREAPARTGASGGQLLFVGRRGGYKNFQVLLEAAALPQWPSDVTLLAVGGGDFTASESLLIDRLNLRQRVRHAGFVSDEQLGRLYAAALAAVVPSLLEGFGLPLVEAQCRGTPLLCTDAPVFREIAGEGALYFRSNDPADLLRVLPQVRQPSTREAVLRAAAVNTQRFSWDRAAQQTWQILESVLQRRSTVATPAS